MKTCKQTFVAFFTEKRKGLKIDASTDKKSSDKVDLTMLRYITKLPSKKIRGIAKLVYKCCFLW